MSELSDKLMDIATQASEWDDIRERSEELFPDEFNTAINPRGDQIGRTVCNLLQELADRRIQSQRKMCEQLPESLGTYNRSETKDVPCGSIAKDRSAGALFQPTAQTEDSMICPGCGQEVALFAMKENDGYEPGDRVWHETCADDHLRKHPPFSTREYTAPESDSGEKCQGCGADVEAHTDTGLRFCERAKRLDQIKAHQRELIFEGLRAEAERLHLVGEDLTDHAVYIAIRDILNEHAKGKEFDTYLQGHEIPSTKV